MKLVCSRSPGILVQYLHEMGLTIPKLREFDLYRDTAGTSFALNLEDLAAAGFSDEKIETCAAKYGDNLQHMAEGSIFPNKGKMHEVTGKFVPSIKDGIRSYGQLMLLFKNRDVFEQALDTLFRLEVEHVRALKLRHGDIDEYLVWLRNLNSPTVLSRFLFSSGVRVFYPVIPGSNYGVWVQWGWRFDIHDQLIYRLFQNSETESVFVRSDGNRFVLGKGLSDFFPLIKFMELRYTPKCQTTVPELLSFDPPKLHYPLRLRRDTDRKNRKYEIDRLLQEEQEIRERIEWLRDIEEVFAKETTYRAYFYPLSLGSRDPVFPQAYLRRYPLHKLRQIQTFYGRIGSLGEGVLVCGTNFVQCRADRSPGDLFHISNHLYPRSGMIFQSNPHWMAKAGLRVMTPDGFDLFPYLEVDSDDHQALVEAFLEATVWGVLRSGTEARRDKSDEHLKSLEDAIRNEPKKFIYLIYPKEPAKTHSWEDEDCPLEGSIISEESFRPFDVKTTNIGIHFSMDYKEREHFVNSIRETIVANVMERFDGSLKKMREALEARFQAERETVRQEIRELDNHVDESRKQIDNWRKSLEDGKKKVTSSEECLSRYNSFLESALSLYENIFVAQSKNVWESAQQLKAAVENAETFFKDISEDGKKTITQRIESFDEIEKEVKIVVSRTDDLLSRRNLAFKNVKTLENFTKKLSEKIASEKLGTLDLLENLKDHWKIEDAFAGLSTFLLHSSGVLEEARKLERRHQTLSASYAELPTVSRWFETTLGRLQEAHEKWRLRPQTDPAGLLASKVVEETGRCLDELEKCIDTLKSRGYLHGQRTSIGADAIQYLNQFRARLFGLQSKME